MTCGLRRALALEVVAAPMFAQTPTPTRKELLERDGIVWGSAGTWGTPFEENLAEDQKIAGLSRLWMEVKLNFPNFGAVPDLDWDRAFADAIPTVRARTSTLEYYRVLQQLVVLLHDGHTNVFLPKELTDRVSQRAASHRPRRRPPSRNAR